MSKIYSKKCKKCEKCIKNIYNKLTASGVEKKIYKHHSTGLIAHSLPEISRVIILYGDQHSSLCFRNVNIKMNFPIIPYVAVDLEVGHCDKAADDTMSMLSYKDNTKLVLSPITVSEHMHTFRMILDEFDTWIAHGAPTTSSRVFNFFMRDSF